MPYVARAAAARRGLHAFMPAETLMIATSQIETALVIRYGYRGMAWI
jgi:hypothetical protein